MDTLAARIKEIIMADLGLGEIPKESDLFMEDLGADSLDRVSPTMTIEEEFDIDIPDEEAEALRTVDDLIQYVSQRCKTTHS